MRVLTATSGIIAVLPAALLAAFYVPRLFWRFDALAPFAVGGYRSGIFLLLCSLIFCFLSPVFVGVLSLIWRSSVPRFLILVAVASAIVSLAILFIDPMGRIHAFVAD